jgi:pimeloyl-ACP methyl ester carboxylesterase
MNVAPRKTFRASTGHTYNYYSSAHADKTTILFIHGFPYTTNIWRKHVAYFETRGFGCVVPDMLGLGQTDKPHNPEESQDLSSKLGRYPSA